MAGSIALALGLGSAGCNYSANSITGYEKVSGGVATSLAVSNPRLQKRIEIVSADSRRVTNDLMEARVTLKNWSKKNRSFEYRFQWFDANDFEVSNSAWTPSLINAREEKSLQATAPSSQALTFKLQVRPSQPVEE